MKELVLMHFITRYGQGTGSLLMGCAINVVVGLLASDCRLNSASPFTFRIIFIPDKKNSTIMWKYKFISRFSTCS